MIDVAVEFMGAGEVVKRDLRRYYNANCVSLVKPSRRYIMRKGDDWCAMFTSVVAHMAGFTVGSFPYEVSVMEQVKLCKEWGIFKGGSSVEVKSGDLIFFDWNSNGWLNHVGIVELVDGDFIHTIEGNYSDTVKRRVIKATSQAIAGFASLSRDCIGSDVERLETLASKVLKGELGNGQERKEALGEDWEQVQKMVNKILS